MENKYKGLNGHIQIDDYTEFHLIQWMRNGEGGGKMCYLHMNKVCYVALSSALTTRDILDRLTHTARAGN